VNASSLVRRSTAGLALVLGWALALAATTCAASAPPPVVTPAPAPPVVDASASAWTLPEVPLAHRSVILLQPPAAGIDAAAIVPIAPDPPPLIEQAQWVYDLRYDKADVFLVGVHHVDLAERRQTPRVMGRFALELYSGPTLIERVRFDFPGLGAPDGVATDGGRRPLRQPPSFSAKLVTRVGVMLPATSRGTKLELWDRATNQRWPLPWPAYELSTDPVPDAATTPG
jgi:hypothetical protein